MKKARLLEIFLEKRVQPSKIFYEGTAPVRNCVTVAAPSSLSFFLNQDKRLCCWALGNRAISSKIHLKKFSTTFPLCIVCSNKLSQGPCESTCPGVEIGMYSGFGVFRATNKGGCNHDFFRCCKVNFVIMSQLQNRVTTFWAHKDASYTTLPNSSSGC